MSASRGTIRVIEGISPGSVGISWHYGHWAYGATEVEVDGHRILGEAQRGSGLVANPALLIDGYLKNVCLTDPIAGDSVFNGTRVKLAKVSTTAAASVADGCYERWPSREPSPA